jgi:pullulanase
MPTTSALRTVARALLGHARLAAILLAALAVAGTAPAAPRQSPAAVERLAPSLRPADFTVDGAPAESLLVVHHHRPAGDYEGWNLWCWPEGGDGRAFAFDRRDGFGRTAVVPFAKTPARAGFLIRRGDWEAKDFDQDRFVELAKGRVTEIWTTSGDGAFTTDPSEVDLSLKVGLAFLDSPKSITLAVSRPLDRAEERGLRVVDRTDPRRDFRVQSVRAARDGSRTVELVLARAVPADAVGHLEIRFAGKSLAGVPARPVHARGVLERPEHTPLDARLGAFATPASTAFTTWSPVSEKVELLLYDDRAAAAPTRTIALDRGEKGLWTTTVDGDLHGTPYTYRFHHYGSAHEAPDCHGFAATADSARTVVVDLARLEPEGFRTTPAPTLAQPTDEVLYEVHVRDYSARDPRAPDAVRGTYLGLVHRAPATAGLPSSGLDHLLDLGVTAIHLLPVHDYTGGTGDYNWGYWTTLFNAPESNYATDPADPTSAIRDLRTAVTALHAAGLRVVLDVVYNHTSDAGPDSPFGAAVPYYFFRTTPEGRFTNDSGTGNGFADERPMARKHILDSLEHWLRDYRVDGFRFDLLGCHRPETVREICRRVKAIRPDATLYGEPWTGGGPTFFGKGAQKGLPIAVFNDHLRNAIRGDLDGDATGFAVGAGGDAAAIRRGVAGAIDDFANEPTETVNYASAHDNLALWDKIAKAAPSASDALRRAMQKLALGIVLTSQGIPFLHGGSDLARTKGGNHNSYDAGDAVNDFGWSRKAAHLDIHGYAAGLVRLRRAHPAFRMADDAMVREALAFLPGDAPVAFELDGRPSGDAWERILVAYNGNPTEAALALPAGEWTVVVDATRAGVEPLATVRGGATLAPYSMFVAHARRR